MASRTDIKARDGRGRAIRSAETAEQDAKACQLRAESKSYKQIADLLGVSIGTAHASVQRGLAAIPAEAATELRRIELERLDLMARAAMEVLRTKHLTVSHGRIIYDDAGQPLIDDGPVLAAIDRLVKIQERRARLCGLDMPTRTEVTVHDGDSDLDREIERLLADMDTVGESQAEVEAASEGTPANAS